MSVSDSTQLIERARRRVQDVLTELRGLAEGELDLRRFYTEWLTKVVAVTGADSGRCWLLAAGQAWEMIHVVGPLNPPGEPAEARRAEILEQMRRDPSPMAGRLPASGGAGDGSVTAVWCPLMAVKMLRGAVELIIGVETEAAQRGCLKFVLDASESIERFYLLAERRQTLAQTAGDDDERRLTRGVHAQLDVRGVALALANDGRLLIGCDRLTVLLRRGRKFRVEGVSGQDDVERRAKAVRALEYLTARCASTGETLIFPDDGAELDQSRLDLLESYVDESHVKRLAIVPLIPAPRGGEASADGPAAAALVAPPLGALVVEYFGAVAPRADESRRLTTAARCGAQALRNACEYESIFLLPLWRTLGRWRRAALAPGSRLKTAAVAALIGGLIATLLFVPADFTAFCRGTLEPVERRHVFAPLDGTVKRVAVKHGERVTRGRLLIELRNTDLDLAAADVDGRLTAALEQLTAIERILLDEGKQLTAENRARLSGDRSQLEQQIASLERQQTLHAEKRRELQILSPIDGEVTTWNADDLLENRPVRQGTQLLTVAAIGGPWELELRVPDDRSGRVVEAARGSAQPLRVTYSPAITPGSVRNGTVAEIHNSAELRGDDGNTVLVRATIDADDVPQRRPGTEVAAHIHCGRRSLGYVWLQDLAGFVRARVLFRWF